MYPQKVMLKGYVEKCNFKSRKVFSGTGYCVHPITSLPIWADRPMASDGSRSNILNLGRVSHLWVWKIFPSKYQILIFFSFRVQKKSHQGRVNKYPGQKWVSLLFTLGQK